MPDIDTPLPEQIVPDTPKTGGSYQQNPDGSLTVIEQPREPESSAATYPAAKE